MNEKNTVLKDVFPIDSGLEKKSIYEWAELAGIKFKDIDGFMKRDIAIIFGNDPIKKLPVTKYEFFHVQEDSSEYIEDIDKYKKFLEDYYPMDTLMHKIHNTFSEGVATLAFEEYNKIEEDKGRDYSIEYYNNNKEDIKNGINTIKRIHENMKNKEDCYDYEKFEKILMDASDNLNEVLDKIEYPENISEVYAEKTRNTVLKLFDLINETKECKIEEQYRRSGKPLYDIIKETEPERIDEYITNLDEKDIDTIDSLSEEEKNVLKVLDKKLKTLEDEDKELEREEEMYRQKVGKDINEEKKEVGE